MDTIIHPLHSAIAPPPRFTYPFCYEPHALCTAAAEEVQRHIAANGALREEADRGKMFGVLVVEHEGRTGFLAAYSGLLCGRCDLPWFVPPVYDSQQPDGHFKTREAEISRLNRQVSEMESSDERRRAIARLEDVKRQSAETIDAHKHLMAEAKQRRDAIRGTAGDETVAEAERLTRESQFMKAEQRRIKQRCAYEIEQAEDVVRQIDEQISAMKRLRHEMSDELQRWLFNQYSVLDANGRSRTLIDIFDQATGHIPPSGAGDCCAPKLLQYAYAHGLRPLCMAEFWWGASPRTELRRHLHYYPACSGKCKPILGHMLTGLDVDPDPQTVDHTADAELETIYEDAHLVVVCKPSGMLSVPGKSARRSVLSIMRHRYPDAEGPMIVHRLDMDTSGLLVVAKTTAAYHALQEQFAAHTITKQYVALLDGTIPPDPIQAVNRAPIHRSSRQQQPPEQVSGLISLPLRPDPLDRPRQVVDAIHGRIALTRYSITGTDAHGHTIVSLCPLTGRTHQLRIHCAHPDGLATPILGDPLYGRQADRLYLHARRLEFTHPATGERMAFEREAEFLKKK